jgi:hypothetical protein
VVSIVAAPGTSQADDSQREFELTTSCMRLKGYKLEPTTQDQKH